MKGDIFPLEITEMFLICDNVELFHNVMLRHKVPVFYGKKSYIFVNCSTKYLSFCAFFINYYCLKSVRHKGSINQSIKFISNQIKKFDIQCTLCNIHGKLFYNKHVATFSISD